MVLVSSRTRPRSSFSDSSRSSHCAASSSTRTFSASYSSAASGLTAPRLSRRRSSRSSRAARAGRLVGLHRLFGLVTSSSCDGCDLGPAPRRARSPARPSGPAQPRSRSPPRSPARARRLLGGLQLGARLQLGRRARTRAARSSRPRRGRARSALAASAAPGRGSRRSPRTRAAASPRRLRAVSVARRRAGRWPRPRRCAAARPPPAPRADALVQPGHLGGDARRLLGQLAPAPLELRSGAPRPSVAAPAARPRAPRGPPAPRQLGDAGALGLQIALGQIAGGIRAGELVGQLLAPQTRAGGPARGPSVSALPAGACSTPRGRSRGGRGLCRGGRGARRPARPACRLGDSRARPARPWCGRARRGRSASAASPASAARHSSPRSASTPSPATVTATPLSHRREILDQPHARRSAGHGGIGDRDDLGQRPRTRGGRLARASGRGFGERSTASSPSAPCSRSMARRCLSATIAPARQPSAAATARS